MFKIGCQTYTWEMLGQSWTGHTDDLLAAISAAGYQGMEITDTMIGAYAHRPDEFAKALQKFSLQLIAFACTSPSGFTDTAARASDLAMVEKALRFVQTIPGAMLSLGSATITTPGSISEKFQTAATLYNAAGELGNRMGVPVAFHPSSHPNTLLATRADYDEIMRLTDPALIGWVPDTGHILRRHADIMDTLCTHLHRVRYMHLKDVDSEGMWQMLGDGVCDIPAITDLVANAPHFNGWLVLEEESEPAAADPVGAVKKNREKITSLFG
jgi:inosose dehydratase